MGSVMMDLPPEVVDTRSLLIHALYTYDEARDRSVQSEPGASDAFGCRRRAFMRAEGFPEVNYARKLAAIKGTAIHNHIEKSLRFLDPDSERFLTEVTVPGLPGMGDGHVDFVDLEWKLAADWKTTKKKNLRYFPKPQQMAQVQIYGDLLVRAGYDIELLEVVAIPLEGDEEDIRVHRMQRDPVRAEEAYQWFRELNVFRESGEFPPADLSGVICEQYCPFFGPNSCSGKTIQPARPFK